MLDFPARINENTTEHTGFVFTLHSEDNDIYCLFKILLYTNSIILTVIFVQTKN